YKRGLTLSLINSCPICIKSAFLSILMQSVNDFLPLSKNFIGQLRLRSIKCPEFAKVYDFLVEKIIIFLR
ncbi:MAG: hypothetical protein WBM99_08600, partial [Psychromonas sp.]